MPIDYADDPAGQPDAQRPSDRTPLAEDRRRIEVPPAPSDPAEREALHRAHWARVERAEAAAAAREAWSRTVPGFRASWETHEARYPGQDRPAPQTHPDGSWSSGETRKLSPDQNLEATKACADIHDEGERVIFPAMRRVEAANPNRSLAGLEHMLKKADRLKEKIADELLAKPSTPIRQALDAIADSVRFTYAYSSDRYADGVRVDIERLKAEGFELVKLKNLWTDDQYKGINSQWRRPQTGLPFEVQFHTPESLEAKELTHKAYERIRSDASPTERRELKAFQRQVNALLVTPPGTAEIKDFPEKK